MIKRIFIKNYALIDELELYLDSGLNILSGETGAGKSIILGALSLVFGENIDTAFINKKEDTVVVEIDINTKLKSLIDALNSEGISISADITMRRLYNPKLQKNSYFINDIPVTKNHLTMIYDNSCEIIGQHENQRLLNVAEHIKYLDAYAHIENKVDEYKSIYNVLLGKKKLLNELMLKKNESIKRREFLQFAVDEISEVNPTDNDIALYEERKLLQNHEKVAYILGNLHDFIKSDTAGEKVVYRFLRDIENIVQIDNRLKSMFSSLEELHLKMLDVGEQCVDFLDAINLSPAHIEQLDKRIDKIEGLKRKYGNSIEHINNEKIKMTQEIQSINGNENTIESLLIDISEMEKKVVDMAKEISEKRRVWAKTLEHSIEETLLSLGMDKVTFKVYITYQEDDSSFCEISGKKYKLNVSGLDYVEFGIATNPTQPVKSLRKIASGGEISRIMLAIKKSLADLESFESFIFDEMDSGIGGKTADLVGKQIAKLSENKQIICITHLPQIASYGDHHFNVSKETGDNWVKIKVKKLEGNERVSEIARMMSGETKSEAALMHAKELLEGKIIGQ